MQKPKIKLQIFKLLELWVVLTSSSFVGNPEPCTINNSRSDVDGVMKAAEALQVRGLVKLEQQKHETKISLKTSEQQIRFIFIHLEFKVYYLKYY